MELFTATLAYFSRFYCNKKLPWLWVLVVFGPVRVWDRKSAGRARDGMVCGAG